MSIPDRRIRGPRVRRIEAKISRIGQVNHDTIAVTVTTNPDEAPLYGRAGQFCTLQVPGIERPRAYSFARAPDAVPEREHAFLIRLLPDGELSGWFRAADRTGSAVILGGPLGRFAFDRRDGPLVCIAGGSGISAIFALIEQAAGFGTARDCYVFHGARTRHDLCLATEIRAIGRRWQSPAQFRFTQVLSEEPTGSDWDGARGFVGDTALAMLDSAVRIDASVFLCGPPLMVDASLAAFTGAGLEPDRCHYDRFDDAQSPAPFIDNRRCVLCDECLLVKPVDGCIVETSGIALDAAGSPVAYEPLAPTQTSGLYYNSLFVDEAACIRCGACVDACPHGAISRDAGTVTATLRAGPVRTPERRYPDATNPRECP